MTRINTEHMINILRDFTPLPETNKSGVECSNEEHARRLSPNAAHHADQLKRQLMAIRDNELGVWQTCFLDKMGRDALGHLGEVIDCLERLGDED